MALRRGRSAAAGARSGRPGTARPLAAPARAPRRRPEAAAGAAGDGAEGGPGRVPEAPAYAMPTLLWGQEHRARTARQRAAWRQEMAELRRHWAPASEAAAGEAAEEAEAEAAGARPHRGTLDYEWQLHLDALGAWEEYKARGEEQRFRAFRRAQERWAAAEAAAAEAEAERHRRGQQEQQGPRLPPRPPRAAAADPLGLYRDLNLPRTAGPAEIKAAYRALARLKHPDRFPREEDKRAAERDMKGIIRAYGVLKDRRKKALYDLRGIVL